MRPLHLRALALAIGLLAACSSDPSATLSSPDGGEMPSLDGGTIDAAQEAAPSKLETGSGYAVVYFCGDGIGIDGRSNASATFDAMGLMIGYRASDDEFLNLGAAQNVKTGTDGLGAWGAWVGGPTSGKFFTAKPMGDFTFPEGGKFHYAVGRSAAAPTSGSSTFELVGGSGPTNGAIEGTLTRAHVTFDFAALAGNIELAGMIGGAPFSKTTALSAPPRGDGGAFQNTIFSNTNLDVRAALVAEGTRMVVAYRAQGMPFLHGAVVLAKM